MKKRWLLWTLAVVVLLALIARMGWRRVNRVKEERRWYISQLRFEFSAIIDTITHPRHVSMHIVKGDAAVEHEQFVNSKLKYSTPSYLLLYRGDHVEFRVEDAKRFLKGDSLYLNTDQDMARIYRRGMLIHEQSLLPAIHGRPF